MSKLYEKVFSAEPELYAIGCPVIIEAGALQKSTKTNKIYAQLKFKNIGKKDIKALKVSINIFDPASISLNKNFVYQYLDCNAKRDDNFGQRTLIELPDDAARSFVTEITEILFEDGTILSEHFTNFIPVPHKSSLEEEIGKELTSQYICEVGAGAAFKPFICNDLWICTCGAVNCQDEEECHICLKKKTTQLEALNIENLQAKKQVKEIKLKAEQEQKELVRLAEAKKKKTTVAITISVTLFLIFGVLFMIYYTDKTDRYNQAVAKLELNQFDEAQQIFEELGSFKDSEEQVMNADYMHAKYYLEKNDYKEGFKLLKKLGDYSDCAEILSKTQDNLYKKAYTLLKNGKTQEDIYDAYEYFDLLNNYEYKDATEKLETTILQFMVNSTYDGNNGEEYFSMNRNEFKEITVQQAKKLLKGKWIELNVYNKKYKNLQKDTIKDLKFHTIRKVNSDIIALYGKSGQRYFTDLLVRKDSEWGKRYLNVTEGKY